MTDRDDLTTTDRATLATIEATLAGDAPSARDPLAEFCLLLRDSAPQADDTFRQRLRAEVVAAATSAQADKTAPWWRRRLTRRQIVAAGIFGVGLGGAAVATSQVIAMLNAATNATGSEGVQGWSLDPAAPAPVSIGANPARWVGPSDALYEYYHFQVGRERWQNLELLPGPKPTPGGATMLGNGHTLPIPAYLPAGFRWQGVMAIQDPGFGSWPIGSTGAGGGGSGNPWEAFPRYDRRVGAYLVGGDPADRFLILAQLRLDGHPGVRISGFLFDAPDQLVPPPLGSPATQSGATPTPTSHPSAYAAKVAAVALAQPASSGPAATIRVGTAAVQETAVNGQPARWFNGVWEANGRWNDTGDWLNLVWEQGGLLYHLAAQQLPLAELIRVAESLPRTP